VSTVPFRLITPESVVFDGEAELVIAVGTEGEIGILPKHAPFLTALRPGVLRANVVDGGKPRRLTLATNEGFLQALPNRITILVDQALDFESIDVQAAERDLAEATERQKQAGSDLAEYRLAQHAIDFANARLEVRRAV
jgi:F-type H+-transporting ATPase subunit epsilon